MAEAFTSYSIENDRAFKAALDRAMKATQDLRIPFGLISADFYKSQQAIFKLQGPGQYPDFAGPKVGDTGKTRYQLKKRDKYGREYPLLFATGSLANSTLGPNNKGSINKITALSLIIGSSIPYGVYHQSDGERKKLPLRKFLFIGPEASRYATSDQMGRLERWLNILNDHLLKQMKREGFQIGKD